MQLLLVQFSIRCSHSRCVLLCSAGRDVEPVALEDAEVILEGEVRVVSGAASLSSGRSRQLFEHSRRAFEEKHRFRGCIIF